MKAICYLMEMNWNVPEIQAIVRAALHEDNARHDVTAHILLEPAWRIDATLIAKQTGIVCGLPLAEKLFKAIDSSVQFHAVVKEGAFVRPPMVLARLRGKARSILSGERPALNAVQHLSGIATFTHAQVQSIKGTKVQLCDTRKTLPGWRLLQKYAVRCGGGKNHRLSLSDAILIKENHLEIARKAGSDWVLNIQAAMKKNPKYLQLEVQTQRDLRDALRLKPQRILLDNLPVRTLKQMMRTLKKAIPNVEIEFTGGVRPQDLKKLAALRPDRISMGRLTHSTPAFDCSLDITHVYPR